MKRGDYELKAIFLADHEKHYGIYKGDNLIGDLYVYPRFRDARVEMVYGEFVINENNCKEALQKIKEEEVRALIEELLKKLQICP